MLGQRKVPRRRGRLPAMSTTDVPINTDGNGDPDRDATTGRFVVGNKASPGRPPAFDLRKVAEEKAAEHNVDLPSALWQVMEGLLERGGGGGEV